MRKKTLLRLFLAGVVLGAVAAVLLFSRFKGNAVRGEYELYVGSQTPYTEVVDSLMPHLKRQAAFRLYARRLDLEHGFKPGHYLLRPGMSVVEVARMLRLGLQTPVRISVNNVRTSAQLACKLARQIDALEAFGVERACIFADKASGKDFHRPAYQRLVRRLHTGDTVVIKSIDRLGRNYDEILEEWRRLTKNSCAHLVVLDMPLLDTRREANGVTGEFIADMVLQLLSYVAHIERDNIRRRQAEGIAAARARGVRFGRPRIERPDAFETVRGLYSSGGLTCAEAAEACGVSESTFRRWIRALEGGR